jgi:hypothetical protein
MVNDQSNGWWRPDALLPAVFIIGPFFFNKLIYIYFPGYPAFVAADYACRIFSLAFLYLLLRNEPTSLPIPWRLAVPSTKKTSDGSYWDGHFDQRQRRRRNIHPISERS